MATDIIAIEKGVSPYRISTRQYLEMIISGIIPHQAHVELLDGRLVDQMTKNAPHTYAVSETVQLFRLILPANWLVREEKPLILGTAWRPEPDVAIVRGPKRKYRPRDPGRTDTVLLVEVSDTTYSTDRGEKWRAYASARIPIYWIINLGKSQVEVYSNPTGRGKKAAYREVATFGADAEIPIVIDEQVVGRIAVNNILS